MARPSTASGVHIVAQGQLSPIDLSRSATPTLKAPSAFGGRNGIEPSVLAGAYLNVGTSAGAGGFATISPRSTSVVEQMHQRREAAISDVGVTGATAFSLFAAGATTVSRRSSTRLNAIDVVPHCHTR